MVYITRQNNNIDRMMLSARDGEKNRRELLANMPKYVNGNISNDFLSGLLFFFWPR